MQFHHWKTDYNLYCEQIPKRDREDYKTFFAQRAKDLYSTGVPPLRLYAEECWNRESNPYYNIHPNLAAKLCKVDLSKIPSTLFQMPHGSRAVNIRFAENHEEFTVNQKMVASNRAITGSSVGVMPAGSTLRSILMIDNRESSFDILKKCPRNLLFIMDFGVYTEHRQPVYPILGMVPVEGKSIEDILQQRGGDNESYDAMLRNIMRLAVTIGFLSNNPTICEHDVLSKDRATYLDGNDTQREIIVDRAKRRGKNGYNIGNDLMFLGARPMGERRTPSENGRELEYAHIRGGHPHPVRYGPQKSLVKIMWFAPTTVRDDLPFKKD